MRNYQDEIKKHLLHFMSEEKADLVILHSNVLLKYTLNRIGEELHREGYTERHVRRMIRVMAIRLGLKINGVTITEAKR